MLEYSSLSGVESALNSTLEWSSPTDFNARRSQSYIKAMHANPNARLAELNGFKKMPLPDRVDHIVELGGGSGFLTQFLYHSFPTAKIDVIENSDELALESEIKLDQKCLHCPLADLSFQEDSVDMVVSLATFHHVGNKRRVLEEVYRILRKGGGLLIGDVAEGTPTQSFFDEVVSRYCITGHDFDFLDSHWIALFGERCGFELNYSAVTEVPWTFTDEASLVAFAQGLFGLEIEGGFLLDCIKKILKPIRSGSETILPWQLGYYSLVKR